VNIEMAHKNAIEGVPSMSGAIRDLTSPSGPGEIRLICSTLVTH